MCYSTAMLVGWVSVGTCVVPEISLMFATRSGPRASNHWPIRGRNVDDEVRYTPALSVRLVKPS